MVHLALGRIAAMEAIDIAKQTGCSVWVGSDAINPAEHQQLISEAVKLTRFSYPLDGASVAEVEDALVTIREHHPGEVIWVQYVPKP